MGRVLFKLYIEQKRGRKQSPLSGWLTSTIRKLQHQDPEKRPTIVKLLNDPIFKQTKKLTSAERIVISLPE